MMFNKKLVALRDKKKDLVAEINRSMNRVEQIQFLMGQPLSQPISRPSLKIEEIPEK